MGPPANVQDSQAEQLKKVEDEERTTQRSPRPSTTTSHSRAAACSRDESGSDKTQDPDTKSDAVSNDREMSRLVERTDEQMLRNRNRCSSSLSAYRERNQRMSDKLGKSNNSSPPRAAPESSRDPNKPMQRRTDQQIQLLAKAYYPLKVPVEVYYKDTTATPRTPRSQSKSSGLPGISNGDEQRTGTGMSAAQYSASQRGSHHNRTAKKPAKNCWVELLKELKRRNHKL